MQKTMRTSAKMNQHHVKQKQVGQKRWSVVQKCLLDDFEKNSRAKTERTYWTERNNNKRPDSAPQVL